MQKLCDNTSVVRTYHMRCEPNNIREKPHMPRDTISMRHWEVAPYRFSTTTRELFKYFSYFIVVVVGLRED
jgi:hypothetical protein